MLLSAVSEDKLLTPSASTGADSTFRLGSSQHFQIFSQTFFCLVLCELLGTRALTGKQQTAVQTLHFTQRYTQTPVFASTEQKNKNTLVMMCF